MNTFHHGGRIGDLMFALYTMKELGGGKLILSDYHFPNWDLEIAANLAQFLEYQPYVKGVGFSVHGELPQVNYDLQKSEDDFNPESFPEWDKKCWPSNINIVKRYAVHFGVPYPPAESWLTAPRDQDVDVVVHAPPHRLVRSALDWAQIITALADAGLRVRVLRVRDSFMLTTNYVNSAKVFLGCVSSCNALAEGLGKPTIVEQAEGCFNVRPTRSINGVKNIDVVKLVRGYCNAIKSL